MRSATGAEPTRIQRNDSILLSASLEKVFQTLLDLHSYTQWWPKTFNFKVLDPGPVQVGTRMWVSNEGFVWWWCKVVAIQENQKIAFRYEHGAWEGDTEWILTPEPGGVRVTYSVDIQPGSFWLRGLARIVNLGKMHSKQMNVILEGLKGYLR